MEFHPPKGCDNSGLTPLGPTRQFSSRPDLESSSIAHEVRLYCPGDRGMPLRLRIDRYGFGTLVRGDGPSRIRTAATPNVGLDTCTGPRMVREGVALRVRPLWESLVKLVEMPCCVLPLFNDWDVC